MKKILIILFAIFLLQSCNEYYYGQGYVFIQNHTEAPIWCDVTYNLGGENNPVMLYYNGDRSYQMNYGDIYVSISIDGKIWYFEETFLEIGESLQIYAKIINETVILEYTNF